MKFIVLFTYLSFVHGNHTAQEVITVGTAISLYRRSHSLSLGVTINGRFVVKECLQEPERNINGVYVVKDLERSTDMILKDFASVPMKGCGDFEHFETLRLLSIEDTHLAIPLEIIMYEGRRLFLFEKYEETLFDMAVRKQEEGIFAWEIVDLQTIVRDMTTAIQTLQNYNLIHGDLKMENIFIRDGRYYLGDFEYLRHPGEKEVYNDGTNIFSICQGTPCYAPPEYLSKEKTSRDFDLFSLGMTLFVITTYYDQCPRTQNLQRVLKYQESIFQICSVERQSFFESQMDLCLKLDYKGGAEQKFKNFKQVVGAWLRPSNREPISTVLKFDFFNY